MLVIVAKFPQQEARRPLSVIIVHRIALSSMLSTELTKLLGVENPVMLAGMGGIAGKELVAAVCNAGGFGE